MSDVTWYLIDDRAESVVLESEEILDCIKKRNSMDRELRLSDTNNVGGV